MAPRTLTCKECGTDYPLEARYVCEQCFGPLEVAYDHSRPRRRGGEAQDPGRPGGHLALRGLPAARRAPARSAAARPDAAAARRPARRAPRPRRALDQERRRQPDPLVQGPGRRGRAREGARARLRDGRLRLDRQPRQRRRRSRGRGGTRLLRLRARRPRGAEAARDRRLRHQAGRGQRQLRRRQPALHRALPRSGRGRSSTSTCGPYYAEGSKTIAYETVEQLGWELPDRVVCPIASGSLFTKIARGIRRVDRPRPGRGRAADLQRRPGRRLRPGRRGVRGGSGRLPAAAPGHDRQEPRDRRPRRRRLRARARPPHRRLGRVGHRRRDPRRDQAARRDHRDLHRDRRRRHHRGAREARRARRDLRLRARRRRSSPARA